MDLVPALLPIIASDDKQPPSQCIFLRLQQFLQTNAVQIDCVWGGLEAGTTKKLRPRLCELLGLSREKMVLKVYWRND